MALTLEEIRVLIKAETAPFQKALQDVKKETRGAENAISGLQNTFSKLKGVVAALAIGKALFDIGKYGTQMALEVSASTNQVKRIMGESTQSFLKWAENGAIAFNIAKADAVKYGAVYSNLFSNFIKDTEQLSGYTVKMLETSAVVASATGRSMDDVMNRIRSGMLGSTEAIEDLGINVNVAMIKSTNAFKQFANGQSWEQLDFNTQQAIRMMAILEQASTKYGNSLMEGPNTSIAYFTALLKDSALNIGNALLPVIQAIMPILNGFASALRTVTGILATFMQLLFGKKIESTSPIQELSDSTQSLSDNLAGGAGSANDLADGVGKAGKAAKQAKKELLGLMGFDEINLLNKNDNNDSSDGGSGGGGGSGGSGSKGGAGGGIKLPKVNFGESFAEEDNKAIIEFLEKFKTLLQPTIDALKRLQEALKPLGTFTYQALVDFYEYFLKPVGIWVLGEGLPKFIDIISKTLNNIDFPKINGALRDLFDSLAPFSIEIGKGLLWFLDNILSPLTSWTISEVVPLFLEGLSDVIDIITDSIKGFEPYGKALFEKFLKPIASWTGGAIVKILKDVKDALDKISDWVNKNSRTIGELSTIVLLFMGAWKVTELLAFIRMAGGLTAILTGIAASLWGAVTAKIADVAQTVILTGMYAAETIAKWASVAATTAMTVATWALNAAIAVLTSPITLVVGAILGLIAVGVMLWQNWDTISAFAVSIFQSICDFIGGVCNSIGQFFVDMWNGIVGLLTPVGQFFTDRFTEAWNGIVSIFSGIGSWFSQRWQDIVNVFSGVGSWFGGVFQSAWNAITSIFNGLGSFFSGVWNSVVSLFTDAGVKIGDAVGGTFKGAVNGVLGTIEGIVNGFIDMINGTLNVIRSLPGLGWVGSIGRVSLPRLAKGGIVDSATLAIVGEAGKEAVMPLENNTGWITDLAQKVADRMPASTNASISNAPMEIIVQIGSERFGRFVINEINQAQRSAGRMLLDI